MLYESIMRLSFPIFFVAIWPSELFIDLSEMLPADDAQVQQGSEWPEFKEKKRRAGLRTHLSSRPPWRGEGGEPLDREEDNGGGQAGERKGK